VTKLSSWRRNQLHCGNRKSEIPRYVVTT